MSAGPETTEPRAKRWGRLAGWPAAIVLLAIHAALAFSATLDNTLTWDEGGYLSSGVAGWTAHRYDFDPIGGLVTQRLGALPLVLDGVSLSGVFADAPTQPDVFEAAQDVVFGERGRAERVLPLAHAAMTLLSVALGALVYLWSRRLFGRGGALVSLALFAFCPNFLAHGPLVTSDVAASLFFLAACGAVWRLLHRVSPGTVLLAGLATGGLFLSKMSAPLIVPIAAILLTVRLAVGRPLLVAFPGYRLVVRTRGLQAAWLSAAAAGVILGVCVSIWAGYGFRFVARSPGGLSLSWELARDSGSLSARAIAWARDLRLLPEAWLYGFGYALRTSAARLAFLNGEVSTAGWPWFFPYAVLVKTPVATLATFAAAAWAGAAGLRSRARDGTPRWQWRGVYRTAPLWALFAVYWTLAVTSHLNLGVRHVLPAMAPSFVLAGAAGRWLAKRRPALRWGLAAMLLAVPLESVAVHPHYLAFFNVLAGGPRHGYEHLVDSSLDWGQDLPALKRWLDEHGLQGQDRVPVYISYFGNGNVRYYGIQATILPGFGLPPQELVWPVPPLLPGVYCMSVTLLQGVYWLAATGTFWSAEREQQYQRASWALERARATGSAPSFDDLVRFASVRMARLSHYLRGKEPRARINHTIFVYALGEEDLAALDGAWPGGVPPPTARSSDRDRASADHP